MANLFYFVRDFPSADFLEQAAKEHGIQFVKTSSQYALMIPDTKGMPKSIAYLNEENGLCHSYISDKKKSDLDLIGFFQDVMKIPVVTDTSKFAEKVLLHRRLTDEIANGRDGNLEDILLDELTEFVSNFRGTEISNAATGRRIARNKERKNPL